MKESIEINRSKTLLNRSTQLNSSIIVDISSNEINMKYSKNGSFGQFYAQVVEAVEHELQGYVELKISLF